MTTEKIDEMLNDIQFDKFYVEATFQYKLLLRLAKLADIDEDNLFPERNIERYGLKSEDFLKKEIDIVIENQDNKHIAMELKMPMNGQYPEQMYKFVEDIKFLEELKDKGNFSQCFFIVVTYKKGFWEGAKFDGIYSFFRKNEPLQGKIPKPTGSKEDKSHTLRGKYLIEWKKLKNEFQYFVVEV
jgi:hypothetical protein